MTEAKVNNRVDLHQLFLNLQGEMLARAKTIKANVSHPNAAGDAGEINWLKLFGDYLPRRYQVCNGFVLDSTGRRSDQIDIIVFDQQYSPFLLHQEGVTYVPAESVYAVLEVKPELTKAYIEYAGVKASSVRTLHRTSAPIPTASGVLAPKPLHEIVAGILTVRCQWTPALGKSFDEAITGLSRDARLQLGCCLEHGSFAASYEDDTLVDIAKSKQDSALIFVFMRLLAALQSIGTVPAIDFSAYGKSL